ncbi:hypothetical protein [Novosphingobium lindaniclasticum]|uniref:Uncharacterized protein n=1 Tax=Novosphingobium lindaniclasticum LE124 TaxID=1096930 RepID=T0HKH0_9SPHN|nr:hypothetical protein [Novosphingobium lindaniclasticum]EQB12678.1 hypothetical protein L284_14990 [Novosphingobium lindaniclasticum LE124]
MATVTIQLERYAYPRMTASLEIPAMIVGDIAVHRRAFWGEGDAPSAATATRNGYWTATHVPSGLNCGMACPLPERTRKRADVVDWAKRWQAAIPEYFEAARTDPEAANRAHGRNAIEAARYC